MQVYGISVLPWNVCMLYPVSEEGSKLIVRWLGVRDNIEAFGGDPAKSELSPRSVKRTATNRLKLP